LIYINNTACFARKTEKSFEFQVISYIFATELESAEHIQVCFAIINKGAEKLPD